MARPVRSTRSKANKAKKTAKPQPKFTLKEIPHQLVFRILKKMTCVELVRMRKTCKYINNTVEEHKEVFSKRIETGCDLTIELETKKKKTNLVVYNENAPHQTISLDSKFEDLFSGVSIKTIFVTDAGKNAYPQELFAKFLKRLNLSCDELTFDLGGSLECLVQLANLVDCRTTHLDNMFLGYEDDPISILLSSHRKSTFTVSIDENILFEQFEQLMNFKKVSCYEDLTTQQVLRTIKGIMDLTDFGTLQELSLNFRDANPFFDQNFVFPPTKRLWDMDGVPDHFGQELRPAYILKLDLTGDKCAIIIKNMLFKEGKIRFINDTPEEILGVLTEELCIKNFESSDKRKYLESSEDEQIEQMREIYLKNCTLCRSKRTRYAELFII